MLKKFPCIAAAMLLTAHLSSCATVEKINDDVPQQSETNATDKTLVSVTIALTDPPTDPPTTQPFSVDISVPEDAEIPDYCVLEGFETVMQEPELPTGCEVTALAEVLAYLGFDIDKVDLCDNFMPIDYDGAVNMYYAYIGDPKSYNGFGCYAPVIVKTAYEYFESVDSPCYAVDLTGTDLRDIFYQISQGRPAIIWSTMGQRETYPNYKWTAGNGEDMVFNDYQHCLAIYGYDYYAGVVYAADPLVGNTTYDMQRFERIYEIMYKQAVVICGDAGTEGSFVPDPEIENNEVWSRKQQLLEMDENVVYDNFDTEYLETYYD